MRIFLWKTSFNDVEHSLSNMERRGLRLRAFNVLLNLLYVVSILAVDRDLMVFINMAEEL